MKNILSIILLLCSISSFGQRTLQTKTTNFYENTAFRSAVEEYKLVNNQIPDAVLATMTYAQGNGSNYSIASHLVPVGKLYFIRGIWVSCNRKIKFRIAYAANNMSLNINNNDMYSLIDVTKPTYIPINQILRSGYQIVFYSRGWVDSDQTDASVLINYDGVVMTDDINYDAKNKMLWIGDSILNGTGPTLTENFYPFITRNYMITQGCSIQNIIKAISGSTTAQHLKQTQLQNYNIKGVKQIIISLGTNDAGQSISKATYKANLKAMIDILLNNEDLPNILILSNPPVENNTTNSFVTQYVTALAEIESEYNSSRVKTLNISTAFDRTSSSFYASTDTPGGRVHPNDSGNAAIYTVINTYLQTVSGLAIINALK